MKRGCITIGVLFLTALSSPFLAIGAVRLTAIDQIYDDAASAPKHDTALVLGAAAYPSRLSDMLEDRVQTAIDLYEQDKVDKIVMSGGPEEAPAMKAYAEEKGVPGDFIVEDPNGLNTLASVKNLTDKTESLTIVSQRYHLSRALFIAGSMGIDAVGVAADRQLYLNMEDYRKREFWATGKAILDVVLGED